MNQQNKTILELAIQDFIANIYIQIPALNAIERFMNTFSFAYRYYIPIYVIPLLIYKKK